MVLFWFFYGANHTVVHWGYEEVYRASRDAGRCKQQLWIPWLKQKLEQNGIEVYAPDLPTPESPSLDENSNYVIENCLFEIDEDTALIGHSSGAVAVLIVSQKLNRSVERVVAIAAFKDNDFLKWEPNNRLFDVDFDFGAMKRSCRDILFIHSDDDPYCPLEHAEWLAEKTGGKLKVMPNHGHFNLEKSEKFKAFPELLTLLTEK